MTSLDMLYMDQFGALPAHLGFAPDRHGHRHSGERVHGSAEFVRTVTGALLPVRPDPGSFIECPGPALQQYADLRYRGTSRVLRRALFRDTRGIEPS